MDQKRDVETETIGKGAGLPSWEELGKQLITVIREHAPPDDVQFRKNLKRHLDMAGSTNFDGSLVALQRGQVSIPAANVGSGYSR